MTSTSVPDPAAAVDMPGAPQTATAIVDPADAVGMIDRRLFGAFVEHMGRGVYTGIHEPGHPEADEHGFRRDVMELIRELGVTVVRYPGGNFVSGYRWEDGVGPLASRPVRLNLAWHATEPNQFGIDEFIRWAAQTGVEPMLAINLGTRGVQDAMDLLEYANHPGGTTLSDQRIANGALEPHAVRMWCLGNELDGAWQLGHKTAAEYGRLAAEVARGMRQYDPSLELIACGSSGPWMATFIDWERTVLRETQGLVDGISAHNYYQEGADLASFLASGVDLDRFIERMATVVDEVADALPGGIGDGRRPRISVDEWNVTRSNDAVPPTDWKVLQRLGEEAYTVTDAVVVGSLLISLMRHADRVASACLAQLVNVLAPIRSEPGGSAWRQTTFHPFALAAHHARGLAIPLRLATSQLPTAEHGPVAPVDAVAAFDRPSGRLTLFVVNRHPSSSVDLSIDLGRIPGVLDLAWASVVHDTDRLAVNTEAEPDRVVPQPLAGATLADGSLRLPMPPISWVAVLVQVAEGG